MFLDWENQYCENDYTTLRQPKDPMQSVAHQTPLSMGFSRQEYWSGLPFPSSEGLPDPGIEPQPPALQADSLSFELQGSPFNTIHKNKFKIN